MSISIIIGLLIALVIICATTIVNNMISHNYKELTSKWDNRTYVITDITTCIGNIHEFVKDLVDNGKLSDVDKQRLFSMMSNIHRLLNSIRNYERSTY